MHWLQTNKAWRLNCLGKSKNCPCRQRSGVAAILNAILEIQRKKSHTLPYSLFTIQEELGLFGSRFVNVSKLGKPKLAWNWDGRGPQRITHAAIGGRTLSIQFHGIASHAGGAADRGVSAVTLAGLAIHDLVSGGWHGEFSAAASGNL